jgi:hypothetical protein
MKILKVTLNCALIKCADSVNTDTFVFLQTDFKIRFKERSQPLFASLSCCVVKLLLVIADFGEILIKTVKFCVRPKGTLQASRRGRRILVPGLE